MFPRGGWGQLASLRRIKRQNEHLSTLKGLKQQNYWTLLTSTITYPIYNTYTHTQIYNVGF